MGAETLRGSYPVGTINIICQISKQAEKFFDNSSHFEYLMQVMSRGGDVLLTIPIPREVSKFTVVSMQEAVSTQTADHLKHGGDSASAMSSWSSASYQNLHESIKTMAANNVDSSVYGNKEGTQIVTPTEFICSMEV